MISKHNTTRFAAGGMGGAARAAEPSSVSRAASAKPVADSGAGQIPVIWANVREALRRRLGDRAIEVVAESFDAEKNAMRLAALLGDVAAPTATDER